MALSRSEQMSRIRGKNTGPEKVLRSALWRAGFRYRLHYKTPAGRPDVVFPSRKVAVFIDGCFWHGCPAHYSRPRSREAFWSGKLADNVARDRRQTAGLETAGWRVVRVWEHAVYEEIDDVVQLVRNALYSREWVPEDGWRVVLVTESPHDRWVETRFLERLRQSSERRQVTGRRVTAKWKRPRVSR